MINLVSILDGELDSELWFLVVHVLGDVQSEAPEGQMVLFVIVKLSENVKLVSESGVAGLVGVAGLMF
jgi:hypothetical protein